MIELIQNDIKSAMRAKATNVLNVLRALKNEITNSALRKGNVNEPLTENEILAIVRKEISKREDSIKAFNEGGRVELATKEQLEIGILSQYLPEEMTDEELEGYVEIAIVQVGATSMKDMGKVIKDVVANTGGRASNKQISTMVKLKLERDMKKNDLA